VVPEPVPRVDHDQVVSESLAEHVGAVARDAIAGRVDGHPPFTPEGEVDDDRSVELVRHGFHARSRQRCKERAIHAAVDRPLAKPGSLSG
jgi:hypothetical protein